MDYQRSYTRTQPLNIPRSMPEPELFLPQLAHMREEESRRDSNPQQRRPVLPPISQSQGQGYGRTAYQGHPALAHRRQDEPRGLGLTLGNEVHPALADRTEGGGSRPNVFSRKEVPPVPRIAEFKLEHERYHTNDPRQAPPAQDPRMAPQQPGERIGEPLFKLNPSFQPHPRPGPGPNLNSSPTRIPQLSLTRQPSRRLPLPPLPALPREDKIPSQKSRRSTPAPSLRLDEDRVLALAYIREAQRLLTPAHLRSDDTREMQELKELTLNPAYLRNKPSVSASERYYGNGGRRGASPVEKPPGRHASPSALLGAAKQDSDSDPEQEPADLAPQPSTSPDDPLNWSWGKKHAVLLALIPGCLLSDWTLTWGTTVFELQAPEWHMSLPAVAQSVSPGIFMQGPGGILAVPLCQRYGRLPVLFWSQLLSLLFTIGAAVAPGYASFTAMRTLEGFFGAAPQVIGLSMIHDMFFFHERARKINIWAASFLIGPYLGPFISSLLLLRMGWRADFGVLVGFYALSLLMVVVLGDETLFDRSDMDRLAAGEAPDGARRGFSVRAHLVALTVGIPSRRRCPSTPSLWRVLADQCALLTRPALLVPTALFVTPVTMWTIGMVSTVSMFVLPPRPYGYGFSYVALAMLYLAPMLGTLLAEAWGHWFNDVLERRYGARHGPEARLSAVYPAALVGVVGLVLYGQTLQHGLHWTGLAFGWAMLCFCTLACMTAISAYTLDCFPDQAALAGSWINFWRVVGGFTVIYFQIEWVHRNGPAVAFGCQAVVIAGATLTVVATQVWGRTWRERFPPPVTEE